MKRLFLALLFLCLTASSSWATISETNSPNQRANARSTAQLQAVAFPNNVVSGHTLVLWGLVDASTTTNVTPTITVTDTQSHTWTVALSASEFTGGGVYRRHSVIAFTTATCSCAVTVSLTVTNGDANDDIAIAVDEFQSDVVTLTADGSAVEATSTGTAATVGITTAVSGELILGAVVTGSTAATLTAGSGYTEVHNLHSGGLGATWTFMFKVVTTATSYTVDATLNASDVWIAQGRALKDGTTPAAKIMLKLKP